MNLALAVLKSRPCKASKPLVATPKICFDAVVAEFKLFNPKKIVNTSAVPREKKPRLFFQVRGSTKPKRNNSRFCGVIKLWRVSIIVRRMSFYYTMLQIFCLVMLNKIPTARHKDTMLDPP